MAPPSHALLASVLAALLPADRMPHTYGIATAVSATKAALRNLGLTGSNRRSGCLVLRTSGWFGSVFRVDDGHAGYGLGFYKPVANLRQRFERERHRHRAPRQRADLSKRS